MVRQFRAQRQALGAVSGATQDVGQIAVIEDDGTIVTTQNPFDLPSIAVRLSPMGSGGSYLLSQRAETLGGNFGTAVNLSDDDSREVTFTGGFRFPFFGTTYLSVFINSDGNLTFGQGDSSSNRQESHALQRWPASHWWFFRGLRSNDRARRRFHQCSARPLCGDLGSDSGVRRNHRELVSR